ncbi:MAG: T9SS type A sorting domain-containing protein, partial [Syntrophothermus sp.]
GTGTITLQGTDSVDVNVAVTITGTLKTTGGRAINSASTLTFGNSGVFDMAVDGGAIPLAKWNTGSTLLLSGLVAKAPTNSNQDFYNVTVNSPGYTTAINMGWAFNTIGGTVRVINSNKIAFRFTNNSVSPNGTNNITINGDVIVDDANGYITSTGSSGGDTIVVAVKGNLSSNGVFNLANGSAAMATWLIGGNLDIKGGTFSTHSATNLPDSIIFNGTAKQTFVKNGDITSLANVRFGVRKGATLDLDTNNIGTSTNTGFLLEPGATVITRHANGLKGNLRGQLGQTLSTAGNYVYEGTVAQTDSLLPGTVNNLTFNNPAGFILAAPVKVNGVLTLQNGTVNNTTNAITIGTGGSVKFLGGKTTTPIPGWTGVENEAVSVPKVFALSNNYPNPFNPSTKMHFTVAGTGYATLKVFNILGQQVATLFNGVAEAGKYINVTFSAGQLPSGIYFAQLEQNGQRITHRMMLMK